MESTRRSSRALWQSSLLRSRLFFDVDVGLPMCPVARLMTIRQSRPHAETAGACHKRPREPAGYWISIGAAWLP